MMWPAMFVLAVAASAGIDPVRSELAEPAETSESWDAEWCTDGFDEDPAWTPPPADPVESAVILPLLVRLDWYLPACEDGKHLPWCEGYPDWRPARVGWFPMAGLSTDAWDYKSWEPSPISLAFGSRPARTGWGPSHAKPEKKAARKAAQKARRANRGKR